MEHYSEALLIAILCTEYDIYTVQREFNNNEKGMNVMSEKTRNTIIVAGGVAVVAGTLYSAWQLRGLSKRLNALSPKPKATKKEEGK